MHKLAILLLFATACSSTPPAPKAETEAQQAAAPAETRPERSGSVPIAPRGISCNSAVVVDGANGRAATMEDQWIAENYPGAKVAKRSSTTCNDKPADIVEIETANGQKRSVYFAPTAQ
ncbi:MAG TPA: hypothetical protein VF713_24495 [Thermoanaerobaculia bacterium]